MPRLKLSCTLALLLFCLPGQARTPVAPSPAPARPGPPNVVIITADAMRADMLGILGESDVKTPHLDAIAQEGAVFSHSYCHITTTTPSHAVLFSSLYPFELGAYTNRARVPDRVLMLPEILKQHGYHTGAIVNLPWLNPEVGNVVQGISELARCNPIRKADKTNDWALGFLDRQKGKDKPFYLWIHYIDNHTPYHAPGQYERMYYPADKDPRAGKTGSLQAAWKDFSINDRENPTFQKWLQGLTDIDYVVAQAKGSVSWIDEKAGEVVQRLKANGQWENTLFVFTSDHGESLGEHGLYFGHSGLFEVTARVPLILVAPGGPQGIRRDDLVGLVDIAPTVLKRLGIAVPKPMHGMDLLAAEPPPPDRSIWLEHAGRRLAGLVTAQHKYLKHLRSQRMHPAYPLDKGKEELYDLAADPQEITNLATSDPGALKALRERWKNTGAYLKQNKSGKGEQAKIDAPTQEMLRSLGYTD